MLVKNDSRDIIAINSDLAEAIKVEPLSSQHRADLHGIEIKPKRCFQNTYNLVTRYPDKYAYVLGVNSCYGFAFEHAFIKDLQSGEYIDPTLDAIGKLDCESGISSLLEFDAEELTAIVFEQGDMAYPPDFNVMSKLKLHPELFITFKQCTAMEKTNDGEYAP